MTTSEAIALGSIDSGVLTATNYPGAGATPVFNALKKKIKSQESTNEKLAYELSLGISYAGKRSICIVKSVGMNVLSDSLINSCFSGVNGGLVLVVVDDMYCNFSTDFQDSRAYQELTKTLILEPSSPQEAYEMIKEAFKISEKVGLPILIRIEKRLVSLRGKVRTTKNKKSLPKKMKRDIKKWVLHPPFTINQTRILYKKEKQIQNYVEKSKFNMIKSNNQGGNAIIISGSAYSDLDKISNKNLLKIGTFPIPKEKVKKFLKKNKNLKVIEKGFPLIEKEVIRISSDKKINGQINNKVRPIFEEGAEDIRIICRHKLLKKFYSSLKKNKPKVTFGDIGGYTKGAFPPCNALDSAICMGASIGMGIGANLAGVKKVFSVIGDSTFIHSGIPALIEAVEKKTNLNIFIIDNHGAISTGGQEVYGNLDKIIKSVKGVNFKRIKIKNLSELNIYKEIRDLVKLNGVSVFIADFLKI